MIYFSSLKTCDVPQDWKVAKVVPIYKNGEKKSVCNYRPVSLLSTCSKVLEHFIFKHIITFLESETFLVDYQHGFRRGFSTVTQLLHTVHTFGSVIDNSGQVDTVFLDFAKAFDRVSHRKLLYKLKHVLDNDCLLRWMDSYLTNRKQFVCVGNAESIELPVLSGVPQGSVLGPLLFLVFINDLRVDKPSIQCRFFADDCVLFSKISCVSDQKCLEESIQTILLWCKKWQMDLNVKKCVQMSVTLKKVPLFFSYTINSNALEVVNEYKYLGVTITSNLSWAVHIEQIIKKASSKLWSLRRKMRHCTSATKLTAYKSLIRPLLEYADIVWDPHSQSLIHQLEGLQKKSLRFIYNSYGIDSHVTPLYAASGVPILSCRRKVKRLKFLHNIIHNKAGLNFDDYLEYNASRDTRWKHENLLVELRCRKDVFKYSFFPRSVCEWNELPPSVTAIASSVSFASAVDELFSVTND